MNKAELIEKLADKFDGSKAEAARALSAVTETVTHSLAAGEKVSITGFGVFEKIQRSARMVRNPRTGERKRAKATAVAKFRPGTDLKAFVSGEKKVPRVTKSAASATQKATAKSATTRAAKSTPASTAKVATGKTTASRGATGAAKKATATKSTAAKKTATAKPSAAQASTSKAAASKTTANKATATKSTSTPAAKKTTAKKTASKR